MIRTLKIVCAYHYLYELVHAGSDFHSEMISMNNCTADSCIHIAVLPKHMMWHFRYYARLSLTGLKFLPLDTMHVDR